MQVVDFGDIGEMYTQLVSWEELREENSVTFHLKQRTKTPDTLDVRAAR